MFLFKHYALSLLICLCLASFLVQRSEGQTLQASVSLDLSNAPVWNYTLANLEPNGSPNWLTSFFLPIAAPVSNVLAPNNWTIDTDNATYILWSNNEPPPYPNDIPPGGTISGFQFESNGAGQLVLSTIAAWDHSLDAPGPSVDANVLSPSIQAVPEPGSLALLISAGIGGASLFAHRRFRRK